MTALRIIRYAAWGAVAGVALAGGWLWWNASGQPPLVAQKPSAEIGGDFVLTDQNGRKRSWQEFRGKATAVFFGFTHCPEICPTTLWELSERLKELGPRGDELNVVLISVDPERDTPEILARYLQSFDTRIVALTGSEAEIDAAVAAFRAYRKRVPLDGGDYTMDHSALVFLFGKAGTFVSTLDRHEAADIQMQKIRRVLDAK